MIDRVYVLRDGDSFIFRHFEATVLWLPGHTAGLTALLGDAEGVLFSSDHLVQENSPSATHDPESIGTYHDSLQRVAALDVRVVLPGRGAPFAGHRRVAREFAAALGLALRCPESGGRGYPPPPSMTNRPAMGPHRSAAKPPREEQVR
jgi:glyoxylase-like metal-dependent hydrolase (beta-lactamase superfamily II)